ncbi:MAG: putative ribosomal RNA small subunit methyltransferase A [Methanomicrobiales archaeon 53_19]|jgi:16S rRNA (adenine1518-N6/adenine1519-N6)-dimethyltransferase|uniref:16S rRNA (adenine(1518)-N(6)/adenine(1519)-N(6))- dimethyltransferase RsmA n=1 Tax=Methanocalculus sp. TaxID=2004547 RepID=UPI00074B199B|nr:16S rRNA (adenine(1518)-N(6)/adenine(1519)-N(6))-dimethyltransferase RsmA [Methanocalculus sp.]KUK70969.1 MAG: putative ribosomal RNA small subunit methyltransferase A [Methanocalculus sp. 52_23]KUL04851.1 MAG: putative ribosomal RNA small subunit methyltransferase A [Methanomicrobiales archaeon 53_19]HIJ06099.1 16S ribosomal RNA methyltransferase A [Methanocalculus sp.]
MRARHDQHFLSDCSAIQRIADAVPIAGRRVLEIGPGKGGLTEALLNRGATVLAVEIDSELVVHLRDHFSDEIERRNLILIHGDATRCALPGFDIAISNLPYSASSPITFRLLEIGFEVAVLMYQWEFACKMMTPAGHPDTSRLSVMVQTYAKVKPLLELPPEAFFPPPEVWSMVVKITPVDPIVEIYDRKVYADLVRALFSQRRKKIRNCLKSATGVFGKERIDSLIASLDEETLSQRPENLPLEGFAELANALSME